MKRQGAEDTVHSVNVGLWHIGFLKWNSRTEQEPKETGPQMCNVQARHLWGGRVKLDCMHR